MTVLVVDGGSAVAQLNAGSLMLAFFVWGALMGLAGAAVAWLGQGGRVADEVQHRQYASAAAAVGRHGPAGVADTDVTAGFDVTDALDVTAGLQATARLDVTPGPGHADTAHDTTWRFDATGGARRRPRHRAARP